MLSRWKIWTWIKMSGVGHNFESSFYPHLRSLFQFPLQFHVLFIIAVSFNIAELCKQICNFPILLPFAFSFLLTNLQFPNLIAICFCVLAFTLTALNFTICRIYRFCSETVSEREAKQEPADGLVWPTSMHDQWWSLDCSEAIPHVVSHLPILHTISKLFEAVDILDVEVVDFLAILLR